jgi:hypothetical protein
MCLKHWRMVPKDRQRDVWRHYRRGQCDDKQPSREYLAAANAAIRAVEEKLLRRAERSDSLQLFQSGPGHIPNEKQV